MEQTLSQASLALLPTPNEKITLQELTAINAGEVKEILLEEHQLSNSLGILAAIPFIMTAQPVAGDSVVLTNGTTTRTYSATSGGDVQYTIAGTVAGTMANLATAITNDASGLWNAYFSTTLTSLAAGVIVIEEKTVSGLSKIYGTWATQGHAQVVDYTGKGDYIYNVLSTLPTMVPAVSNFGTNKGILALLPSEMHTVRNNDVLYGWNEDTGLWFSVSGSGSIVDATSASGGGVKGKATYDSDKGLAVSSGVAAVKLTTSNPGLAMDSSGLTVKVDGNHGLVLGTTGVEVELASADRLTVGASGIDVTGVPTLFKVGGSAVSANVTQTNLDALTGGSATTLHSHAVIGDATSASGGGTKGKVTVDSDKGLSVISGVLGAVSVSTDRLTVSSSGIDVAGVPSLFKVGGSAVSANVTQTNLDALTGGSATTLHSHAATTQAARDGSTKTVAEALALGDPCYMTAAGTVGKALATSATKNMVYGIASIAIPSGTGTIITDGIAPNVLIAATPGTIYYLADAGGLTTTAPTAVGSTVFQVGIADTATDLNVQLQFIVIR